jgi:hypothetical protein
MSALPPNFIVHYNRSEPFRSITGHQEADWLEVVSGLDENKSWGLDRFKDTRYLKARADVERRMYEAFVSKGGSPKIHNPFYCFLGRSIGFESHPKNIGYIIYLKDIPANAVTFTYGDSLLAWDKDYRMQVGPKHESSLCEEIYPISELQSVLEKMPMDPLHLEVQLWMNPSREVIHQLVP